MTMHIFLQFKGGIGTTLAASMLASYLESTGQIVRFADLDPIFQTNLSCRRISYETIRIVDDSFDINVRNLDALLENFMHNEGHMVVDVSSTVVIPFCHYIKDNGAAEFLKNVGKKIIFHMILTGGGALDHTVKGIQILLGNQLVPVLVWENEYFGEMKKNGKTFIQSDFFNKNQHQILGIVKLSDNALLDPSDVEKQVSTQLAQLSL